MYRYIYPSTSSFLFQYMNMSRVILIVLHIVLLFVILNFSVFWIHFGIEYIDTSHANREMDRRAQFTLAQPSACRNGVLDPDTCRIYQHWTDRSWSMNIAIVSIEKLKEDWRFLLSLVSPCDKNDAICQPASRVRVDEL